jgi:hypothetical protein
MVKVNFRGKAAPKSGGIAKKEGPVPMECGDEWICRILLRSKEKFLLIQAKF